MNDVIYRILRADGSITTNKNLIFGIGLNEAIIYSELLSRYYYFEDKRQLQDDGSFFNTIDDLYLGTGLGDRAQRTAIKNLNKLGLLAVKNKGVPPKRYFKINFDNEVISHYLTKGKEIIEAKKLEIKEKNASNPWNSPFPSIAEIESSGERKSKTADVGCNNTNLNNTEINNTIIKGICFDKQSSYRYQEVLNYFLEAYTWYIGKEHPVLKKKQWIDVIESLFTVEIDNMTSDVSEEDEMDMMKKYLLTDFKVEHNMLHYISGDIRKLRYFECGLL